MKVNIHVFDIYRSILLRMRNLADKSCRGKKKHCVFSNSPPFENHAVSEIIWKNNVERGRPRMSIWRMCVACWIPKATHRRTICNTYCFSPAKVVARMRLNVTLVRTLHVFIYLSNQPT